MTETAPKVTTAPKAKKPSPKPAPNQVLAGKGGESIPDLEIKIKISESVPDLEIMSYFKVKKWVIATGKVPPSKKRKERIRHSPCV